MTSTTPADASVPAAPASHDPEPEPVLAEPAAAPPDEGAPNPVESAATALEDGLASAWGGIGQLGKMAETAFSGVGDRLGEISENLDKMVDTAVQKIEGIGEPGDGNADGNAEGSAERPADAGEEAARDGAQGEDGRREVGEQEGQSELGQVWAGVTSDLGKATGYLSSMFNQAVDVVVEAVDRPAEEPQHIIADEGEDEEKRD